MTEGEAGPDRLFVGLISGTSCDGVDAALIRLGSDGAIALEATHAHAIPEPLRARLIALTERPSLDLREFGRLDNAVATEFSRAAMDLLRIAGAAAGSVTAIGSHGQNIWHAPDDGVSLQIGNPSLIAACTGITTVGDFRRRDLALGGQGAPLAPGFHRALFAQDFSPLGVLNVGGIANLTRIDDGPLRGFDTGPGNALMDTWAQRHLGTAMDEAGAWARSGTVIDSLLTELLTDGYFRQAPPRSTGREHFNLGWLDTRLARSAPDAAPADVQRTLLELTARSAADAIREHGGTPTRIAVCGGGAHNPALMERLSALCPATVTTTDTLGFPGDWIEAGAFAWYAALCVDARPAGIRSVTGARQDAVLGGIYPA